MPKYLAQQKLLPLDASTTTPGGIFANAPDVVLPKLRVKRGSLTFADGHVETGWIVTGFPEGPSADCGVWPKKSEADEARLGMQKYIAEQRKGAAALRRFVTIERGTKRSS